MTVSSLEIGLDGPDSKTASLRAPPAAAGGVAEAPRWWQRWKALSLNGILKQESLSIDRYPRRSP